MQTVSQPSLRNFPNLYTKVTYLPKGYFDALVVELCDLYHGKLFSPKAKPLILAEAANPTSETRVAYDSLMFTKKGLVC